MAGVENNRGSHRFSKPVYAQRAETCSESQDEVLRVHSGTAIAWGHMAHRFQLVKQAGPCPGDRRGLTGGSLCLRGEKQEQEETRPKDETTVTGVY